MNEKLRESVEHELKKLGAKFHRIRTARPLGGGCINQVYRIELDDNSEFLLKTNRSVPDDFFACEANGLRALGSVNAIRVLQPIVTGFCDASQTHFFLVEFVQSGQPREKFWQEFGHQLANLHKGGVSDRYGYDSHNYLGSTLQPNEWDTDWVRFFGQQRIAYQVRLAAETGRATGELHQLAERLIECLPAWLEQAIEPPTLIHGDLWSGNYLVDSNSQPVLIDPAVYYGQREAELAMTKLFGGFPPEFFAAYQETWPLLAGWEQRLELYKLYHLLNHLNLFGTSYLSGCIETLRRLS